jgi:hypothetical protein
VSELDYPKLIEELEVALKTAYRKPLTHRMKIALNKYCTKI